MTKGNCPTEESLNLFILCHIHKGSSRQGWGTRTARRVRGEGESTYHCIYHMQKQQIRRTNICVLVCFTGSHRTCWEHRRAGTNRAAGMFISIKLFKYFSSLTLVAVPFINLCICVITGRVGPGGRSWSSWS